MTIVNSRVLVEYLSEQRSITEEMSNDSIQERVLQQALQKLGVNEIRRHIFLCCDQTKPKCCDKQASLESWDYLKTRLRELELTGQGGIYRTKANCLQERTS